MLVAMIAIEYNQGMFKTNSIGAQNMGYTTVKGNVLSDYSVVYDVILTTDDGQRVSISCTDGRHALDLSILLNEAVSVDLEEIRE